MSENRPAAVPAVAGAPAVESALALLGRGEGHRGRLEPDGPVGAAAAGSAFEHHQPVELAIDGGAVGEVEVADRTAVLGGEHPQPGDLVDGGDLLERGVLLDVDADVSVVEDQLGAPALGAIEVFLIEGGGLAHVVSPFWVVDGHDAH